MHITAFQKPKDIKFMIHHIQKASNVNFFILGEEVETVEDYKSLGVKSTTD